MSKKQPTAPFIPSSWKLDHMIAAAMAACDRDRSAALSLRAERAYAFNARVRRERFENDARRTRTAGERGDR